jgi:meso-butanediol dehydrogenase/(S,S)-butanediol dehydrogenase/diacetyl reductase
MNAPDRRVALVTGGAAGIGRACVERLLRDGLCVIFTDRSASDGQAACDALAPAGERLLFETGDVREAQHLTAAVRRAVAAWGRLDVLIANAGVQSGGTLLEGSNDDWQQVLDVNLTGVRHACRAVLPVMRERRGGAIVAVSSINALVGFRGMAAYDASKAAVIALMRHIAVEHGRDGIRANAVCPGATLTDFHLRNAAARGIDGSALRKRLEGYGLLGRVGEPAEIAAAIAFLAGDDASFITGQTLIVDGGYTAAAERS